MHAAIIMDRYVKPPLPSDALKTSRQPRPSLHQVGTWEWDFASGTVTWSDGLYRLLGLEPGAVPATYERFISKVHPEDRPGSEAAAIAAMSQGGTIDSEFRIVWSDGAIRWMANKGEVFNDPGGKPSWAAGALFDITEIREAQLELAAREERYRALATVNAIGEWRATASGEIVQAPFWMDFTGQSESEYQGEGWLDAVHPDDREAIAALWQEALRLGCSVEFTYRARHRSGEYRWILTKTVPIKNADGTVREWIGSDEDVHARRQAEESLRINENRLRLALEAARTITWDYEIRTGLIRRSPNAPDVLGYGSGTLEEFYKWVHPEDAEPIREALRRTVEYGERYDVGYRVVEPTGRTKWLRARGELLRSARKRPDRVIGVTFDITSEREASLYQRKTQEELREMRARLQALGTAFGGYVWISSPDGRIADMPALREFTGLTLEEVQGWGWLNVVHPADRERIREVMQSLMDGQPSTAVDYRVRCTDGTYHWFRSRGCSVRRPDGSVIEWVGLTERLESHPPGFAPDQAAAQPPAAAGAGARLISGAQMRAARAIVNWSVRDLAEASGVSSSTIRRIEEDAGLPETRDVRKLEIIRSTLEAAGVEFLPPIDGKGGVRPA